MTALPSEQEIREYLHGDLDDTRTAQLDELFERNADAAEALQRFAATEGEVFDHLHALQDMDDAELARLRGSGTFEDLMEAVRSAWETLHFGRLVTLLAAAGLFFVLQPSATGSFTATMAVGEKEERGDEVPTSTVCEGSRVSATFTSTGADVGAMRTRVFVDDALVVDRSVGSVHEVRVDEALPTLDAGTHEVRVELAADGWWSDPVLMQMRETVLWAPCP